MTEILATNVPSLQAQINLTASQAALDSAMERLSSGLRINSAADDAAGLAIATRFTSQIQGLNQAIRNANDGISLSQTAEGALQSTTDMLQRIRVLAVQSANGVNSASDRQALQLEVNQLQQEIQRVATTTQFNGLNLLNGELANTTFQVGAMANQTITISIQDTRVNNIGVQQVFAANPAGLASAIGGVTGALTTNNLGKQDLTINGLDVAKIAIAANSTAEQVAAQINGFSSITGVAATATTTLSLSALSAVGSVSFDINSINTATPITVSANISSITDLEPLMAAINAVSGSTGVIAQTGLGNDPSTLTLSNNQGSNILISKFTHSAADAATPQTINVVGNPGYGTAIGVDLTAGGPTPNDAVIVGGIIEFDSSASFTASSSIASTTGAASLFSGVADSVNGSVLLSVATIDISTQAGAEAAISIIDGAVDQISLTRAGLGAVENRFDYTIANLGNASENTSAARSRIQDTDYAEETMNLSTALILQQAGLQMLRQANQLPQNVLVLLQ